MAMLAIGLPIVPGFVVAAGSEPKQLLVTLLVLPLLPAAYLYAAFRRQIADLEIRRNRLITIYLFAAPGPPARNLRGAHHGQSVRRHAGQPASG